MKDGHELAVLEDIHSRISCNLRKGTKGLYHFYREMHPGAKIQDIIPALLENKYLKTIYYCHLCKGTLDSEALTVLDLDLSGGGEG